MLSPYCFSYCFVTKIQQPVTHMYIAGVTNLFSYRHALEGIHSMHDCKNTHVILCIYIQHVLEQIGTKCGRGPSVTDH